MARTIAEIKKQMTDAFMAEPAARERYGLADTDTFESRFSRVSIEGLIFYIMAFAVHVVECLIDSHSAEVEEALAAKSPHTLRWYRDLVLSFGYLGDKPVSHCSVAEDGEGLLVKVAAGEPGSRRRVDPAVVDALVPWLEDNKDAGTPVTVVNRDGDSLRISVAVWTDPSLLAGTDPLRAALRTVVSDLDFDGTLSRRMVEDALLAVPGVRLVEITTMQTHNDAAGAVWEPFGQQRKAASGWWQLADADCSISAYTYTNGNLAAS